MKGSQNRKLKEIARLFSQIQQQLERLDRDDAGIVQLFFDPKFSIYEVSQVHDLPPDKVKEVISNFLVKLLAKNKMLQRFLRRPRPTGEDTAIDLKGQVDQLIESCETPESIGARIRELIGTATQISIPPVPSHLYAEIISKADAVAGQRKDHASA